MEWAESSEEVVIQQLNRLQNTNKVMLCNVSAGETGGGDAGSIETILVDRDKAWVDVGRHLKWIDDGRSFTWLSERDGWRHLYVISRSGKKVKLLTPGAFDVINIESIDEENGWIYFIASPDNPTQRYLYRVEIKGEGTVTRVTPTDQPGTHSYNFSKDSRWAVHTYSSFLKPTVIDLVKLPGHEIMRVIEDNSELHGKINSLKKCPTEFFRVDIGDGVVLDGWMIKPLDFLF